MNVRPLAAAARFAIVALGVATGRAAPAELAPREQNHWPFVVRYPAAGGGENWTAGGPFLFRRPPSEPAGNSVSGFRPFWVQTKTSGGDLRAGYFLYPLFSYTADETTYKWSVFELVRGWDRRPGAGAPTSIFDQRGEFEVFPFWFSRQSGDPALSYRALFPIHGTIKNKLFFERLSWTLFPLYVENENRGAVTTSTPWPIVRVTRGAAQGWGLWPLFNYVERPGVSRHETYLWPLGYRSIRQPHPDDPPGTPPRRDFGALPFYARSTGSGFINEDFFWPFFGYTDRTAPKRYHEVRYFWPFAVQGRGEERYVNRWAPFYTHSNSKGYDKRWFMWPLVRHAHWDDVDVDRTRTQFAYFLYWHETQARSSAATAPRAHLTHLWPLFSDWNNGAGRRQWQVLSPLDVFFPGNEKVRDVWSPLFAVARHDQRAPGDSRTSLLWNAVTWEQSAREERSEFHLGPLLGIARQAGERQITVGNGVFGLRRAPGTGWRMFWLEFPAKTAINAPASR
jgi:hypothetical protein